MMSEVWRKAHQSFKQAQTVKVGDACSLARRWLIARGEYAGILKLPALIDLIVHHPECPPGLDRLTLALSKKERAAVVLRVCADAPPLPTKKDRKLLVRVDRAPKVGGVSVISDAFLKTFEWRKVRYAALVKAKGKFQCCGIKSADGAILHVDHIKPRRKFPELALDAKNLQVLCEACNHGKGNWDQTDWRAA